MALETVVIKIKGDSKELDATIKKIQKVGIVDKKNAESFKKTSKTMGSGFDGLKKKAMALGATMLGAFAIQQVITKAIGTLKDFEKELSTLQSITGSTAKEMEFYAQAAKDVGQETKTSAKDVVEAFTNIGSAQPELLKNGAALAEVTKQALILSKAAGIDATSAAISLTGAMNQYGASADDAAKFADIFATSQQKGSSFIAATSEALKNAGAAAAATGLSFETTNAALQALAKGSILGSEAGTALKSLLLKLSKQNDDKINPSIVGLSAALEELGKKNLDVNAAMKLVGITGAAGLLTLVKQRDTFFELDGALNETGNAMAQMEINTDNLDGSLDEMGNAWEIFILQMSGAGGVLTTAAEMVTSLIRAFTSSNKSLTKETQTLFKENTKSISQATALKNEYEKLNAKTNKTEQETRRLHEITGQLSDMFGTSVVNIDKETGALSLNTTELVKQISIRQALQSEQARELLADKLRFETQVERIKINKEWLDQLKQSKDVSVTVLNVLNDEAGALGITTKQTGELTYEVTKLSDAEQLLVERIRKAQAGLASEGIIKQELINVNETLLESGIDLEAIAASQTMVSSATETTAESTYKAGDGFKALQKQASILKKALLDQALTGDLDEETLKQLEVVTDKLTKAQRLLKTALGETTKELLAGTGDTHAEEMKARDEEDKALFNNKKLRGQIAKESIELAKLTGQTQEELAIEFANSEFETFKEFEEKKREEVQKTEDARVEKIQNTIDLISNIEQQASAIFAQISENKLIAIDNEETRALESQGLGEEELADRQKEIQEKAAKDRADIMRKQAIADKASAIAQATMRTALAVVSALAMLPPNIPLSVIVGTLGAAQVAAIAAQPIPEFHEGKKAELKDGEMFAKILKSESVIPPEQSRKYKGAIDSMIDKKFENYVFQEYMLPMMKSMSKKDVTPYNDVHLWNNQKKQIKLMQESNGLTKAMIKTLDNTNSRRSWK